MPDAQHRADVERGDLEAGVIGTAGDERDVALVRAEGDVDLLLHPSCHLLGAQLALLRLGHVGVDRTKRGLRLLDPAARRRSSASWMASGNGLLSRSPANGRKRLANGRRRLGQPADDRRIVDHPAHDGSEVGEPARADLHADGVAHDVFELVRLVDHDDVVFGQQHAAAGDVEAVEVGVDDDDVGDLRPGRGPARRSTPRPSGTSCRPGTRRCRR